MRGRTGRFKRNVLETNERSRRAKEGIPAPRSRKDKKSGWSQEAKSSKDTTSATGKENTTGMCADSDESEQPSGSGGKAKLGPPSDAGDDHERSGQTLTDTTHERDKGRVRPKEKARSPTCGPERLDMDNLEIDRIDQAKTQEQLAKDDLEEHRKEQ